MGAPEFIMGAHSPTSEPQMWRCETIRWSLASHSPGDKQMNTE